MRPWLVCSSSSRPTAREPGGRRCSSGWKRGNAEARARASGVVRDSTGDVDGLGTQQEHFLSQLAALRRCETGGDKNEWKLEQSKLDDAIKLLDSKLTDAATLIMNMMAVQSNWCRDD